MFRTLCRLISNQLQPTDSNKIESSYATLHFSCDFQHQLYSHSLRRSRITTEENYMRVFRYYTRSTQKISANHIIRVPWKINNSIKLFISHGSRIIITSHCLCSKQIIIPQEIRITLFRYYPSSTPTKIVYPKVPVAWKMINKIRIFVLQVTGNNT